MSVETGPVTKSGPLATTTLDQPRFLVALEPTEQPSREKALALLDHIINELGPIKMKVRLIVIGRQGDQGYVEGVEIDPDTQLDQIDEAIAELAEFC